MLLRLPLSERFSYDADKNMFFINFEGHEVATADDVEAIRARGRSERSSASRSSRTRSSTTTTSRSRPNVIDAYSEMVTEPGRPTSTRIVTRYTTSSFLRMKFGDALQRRGVATYIYESPEEAQEHAAKPSSQ